VTEMREGRSVRKTKETDVAAAVNLDGGGKAEMVMNEGFLTHMLELIAGHSRFDITVRAAGGHSSRRSSSDGRHWIVLGDALREALSDKSGINRYGSVCLPMDEALVLVSLDISGRPYLAFDVPLPAAKVGNFDTELVEEFLRALANHAGLTLHIRLLAGRNTHHIIEAVCKALGHALRRAAARDGNLDGVLSTKGVI
jgi:imidazoleglycerol-phosphate dehydratase